MKDKRFTLNSSANLTGTLSGALKGPKGDKGDPGSTDYNQLENKPDLSVYALKDELPNAGITDYNELQNKPDLSVYALKNELEELRKVVDGIVISTNNSYSVYTIDNSVSTFGMRRSVGETIKEGPYIPELSNGYHYIVLTLNDGNKTTNIDTLAADVKEVKIYYPDDTSYIKFANTKVKDVIELKAQNITDATGMFTNCISLQSADLTQLPSSAIVDHTMFEGVPSSSQIKVANDFNGNNSGFTGQFIQYISGFGLSTSELEITEEGIRHSVYIFPNEAGRIMDFDVWFDNSETEIQYQTYFDAGTPTIEVWVNNSQQTSNTLVVCEKNSGFKNYLRINVNVAEEPKENYITYFALNESSIELNFPGVEKQVGFTLHDYERAYPMNFVIVSDHDFSLNTDLDNNTFYISTHGFDNRTHNVTIRETYSGLEQTLQVTLKQYVGLTVHYRSTDGNYAGDSLVLGNDYSLTFDLSQECDSYGVYAMIYLPIGTYSMHLVNEGFESPQFDRELILTTDTEIWINDTEFTYYDYKPDIPDQYITGFDVDPSELQVPQGDSAQVTIYPYEAGKQVSFDAWFEDTTYTEPDTLHLSIDTYEYDNGMNNAIYCNVLYQISAQAGCTATLVIREDNSEIERRIPVTLVENGSGDNPDQPEINENQVRVTVHYHNPEGTYGQGEWITFNKVNDEGYGTGSDFGYEDDFGRYTTLPLDKDVEYDVQFTYQDMPMASGMFMFSQDTELWIKHGDAAIYEVRPEIDGGGNEPEEPNENSYYVQYTIDATDADDEVGYRFEDAYNSYTAHKYLPYTNYENEKIEIILNDGTITSDLTTKVSDVNYIKYYYPSDTYEIKFREGTRYIDPEQGTTEQIYNRIKTLDHISLEGTSITSLNGLCQNCTYLESVNADFYLNNIYDIGYMFNYCSNLTSIDVSNWNTSNVQSMNNVFYNCSSLTSLDVSNWSVNSVGDMSFLFAECQNLQALDVSNWNTQSAYNMTWMFGNCSKLQSLDVSNWNTGNVNSVNSIFNGCSKLQSLDVSNWNTGNVQDMSGMFSSCNSLTSLDVSNWNTDNVNNMSTMFYNCRNLQSLDVSNWNTGNVQDMTSMFGYCYVLTSLDVSNWNTGNVNNMSNMFQGCKSLTSLDVSNWNTPKLENISYVFDNCKSLTTLDLRSWDTRNITSIDRMFGSIENTSITVSEGLWTLDTGADAYGGTNLNFTVIPCDITSLNVTTDIEDLNNLNTHKINCTLSIQPEANGIFDLETIYDSTYIKLRNSTITLLEGAQGKPLSVTFRSKRNNEISQTIEFTLNADYVIPTFDGTIDFTDLDPKFPSWMEEHSSGDYTFELGTFRDGVDGLVSNNTNVDMSVAYKAYQLTPEEALNMTINYRCESENGCDYLTASLRTTMDGFNTTDPYDDDSSCQILSSQYNDYVYEDASFTTNLEAGVTYYLVFRYRKDGSSSAGVDKACIRSIKFE